MSSPCSACTKRCCANYTVSVNGYDAWLIATRLRMPLASFLICFQVGEGGDDPDDGRGFRLRPGGPQYDIALDKVGGFQRGNPCVFWIELADGRGRCGIYAVRPYVCQTYPAYQQSDLVMLRGDVMCPEGAWSLAGIDLPLFRRRLFEFRIQQDIFAALVAAWNQHVEREQRAFSTEEFYLHLMDSYDRLEEIRAQLSAEEARDLTVSWGGREAAAPSPLLVNLDLAGLPRMTALLERIRAAVRPAPPAPVSALAANI